MRRGSCGDVKLEIIVVVGVFMWGGCFLVVRIEIKAVFDRGWIIL